VSGERFRVGELEVFRVLELEFPLGPAILPIGSEPEALLARAGWAVPEFVTGSGDVVFALGATCLLSEGRKLVLDPCLSFDLRRENPDIGERAAAFFGAMDRAGFPADEVDLVINTHIDGVGWNVRPGPEGWRPAFPKAQHLFPAADLERVAQSDDPAAARDALSLGPLREAGRIDAVRPGAVTAHVSLRSSPGHTPGNVDIWIESEGQSAVVVGDHVLNPLQCADPDWAGLDMDAGASGRVRRALLAECAERNTLLIGPHFGSPGAGRVQADGAVWRLRAEPATT